MTGVPRRHRNLALLAAPVVPLALVTTTLAAEVGTDEFVDYWPTVVRAGWFFAGLLVVVMVGWYVVAPAVSRAVRRRNRNNPTLDEAIARYLRVLVLVVGVFVGAGVAGYGRFLSNSALVVAAGTLAVGVAGQEVIGSLVSGLALVVDPEFNVGNYIEWADGEGTVRSITPRVTRVQSPNGELVTVPNTVLTEQAITRPFGRGRYRVEERIGIDYDDDVAEATTHLLAAARDHAEILAEPSSNAFVDELGDVEVVLEVHFWIENPDRRDVRRIRSEYARAVKDGFEAAGITVTPAAQRDLQGRLAIDERS